MSALWSGIQLGLIIFFLVGPVFILLIDETINHGKRYAILLAMGFWLSDISLGILTKIGANTFFKQEDINYNIGYVTALIFILIGIAAVKNRKQLAKERISLNFKEKSGLLLKGILANTFNPFVIIFWITVAFQFNYQETTSTRLFYFGLFFIIVAGDLLKIFLAHQISKKINDRNLSIIRLTGGILLILFGIFLIVRVAFLH